MEQMLLIAEQQHIVVEAFDFSPPIQGIYIVEEGVPPLIGLNNGLRYNMPQLRSIMAEELGHHFTTVGIHTPQEYHNYTDRLRIDRCEHKALRWAANYLIPDQQLRAVFHDGIDTVSTLAEHFLVTPEIVRFKLRLFKRHIAPQ